MFFIEGGQENMSKNPVLYKSLVFGVIILFVGAGVVSSAYSDVKLDANSSNIGTLDLSDGLVAYWSFDNNEGSIAYDESENSNDGQIIGASIDRMFNTLTDLNMQRMNAARWEEAKKQYEAGNINAYMDLLTDGSIYGGQHYLRDLQEAFNRQQFNF